MPTFPSTLPQPLPISGKPESGSIRTQMDVGPAKVRRRTTATAKPIQFTFRLTGAEFDDMKTFYHTTTLEGSLSFDMNDPQDDSTKSYRFLDSYDWSLIVGAPDPDDRIYDVTVSLEQLP